MFTPLSPGTFLSNNRYEVVQLVGKGGFGAVYEARDWRIDGRRVALKQTIRHEASAGTFEREASVLGHLKHPALPAVIDYFSEQGSHFLVMEFVEGNDLAMVLHNRAVPLPLDHVVMWGDKTLGVLDYMHTPDFYTHQRPVIHRDIKPQNLKLTPHGEIMLLDFGIAKESIYDRDAGLDNTTGPVGTPHYAPPEQVQGKPADARSDLYALGVTLHHLLTAFPPPRTTTRLGALLSGQLDPLRPAHELNPQIPLALSELLATMTALQPEDRPASAKEVREALRQFQPTALPKPDADVRRRRVAPRADINRTRMLNIVEKSWVQGVLEPSLSGAARLQLGLEARPEAIAHAWDMQLQLAGQEAQPLPRTTEMIEVFDTLDGQMLILGAPGAGKTTLLLELARDLIVRAKTFEDYAIPVVFHLSSWAVKRPPLADWLVEELNGKYDVPRKLSKRWVEEDRLLLLLDGLDEVAEDHRAACVEAINAFRQQRAWVDMAVCSRTNEYDQLAVKLRLHGAVLVQPLDAQQVESYLRDAGPRFAALRTTLETNEAFGELAQSPLLLNTMLVAYDGAPVEALPRTTSVQEWRTHLFSAYIERKFSDPSRAEEPRYSPEQTKSWLAWLAQNMIQQAQSVFLIEQLQPKWLPERLQKNYNRWDRIGIPLLLGFIIGDIGIILLTLSNMSDIIPSYDPFIRRMFFFSIFIIIIIWCSAIIGIFQKRNEKINGFWNNTEILLEDMFRTAWKFGYYAALITSCFSSIYIHFVLYLLFMEFSHGRFTSFFNAIPFIISVLFQSTSYIILSFLSSMPSGAMTGALMSVLGCSPSSEPRTIVSIEVVRWSFRRSIKVSFAWLLIGPILFLPLSLLNMFFTYIQLSLSEASEIPPFSSYFSDWQFSFKENATIWLLGLLISILTWGWVNDSLKERKKPNEGIKRSAIHSIRLGILVTFVTGILYLVFFNLKLSNWYSIGNNISFYRILFDLLLTGLSLGVPFALAYGGYAFVSHTALRLTLWHSGAAPLNYPRFLDHCASHIFLYRVGGSYIFMHRMLQEHFASLPAPVEAGKKPFVLEEEQVVAHIGTTFPLPANNSHSFDALPSMNTTQPNRSHADAISPDLPPTGASPDDTSPEGGRS